MLPIIAITITGRMPVQHSMHRLARWGGHTQYLSPLLLRHLQRTEEDATTCTAILIWLHFTWQHTLSMHDMVNKTHTHHQSHHTRGTNCTADLSRSTAPAVPIPATDCTSPVAHSKCKCVQLAQTVSPIRFTHVSQWLTCSQKWPTLKKVLQPSSCQIFTAQSPTLAYVRLAPWVISRVFSTSKGVVRMPVTAPAAAPAEEELALASTGFARRTTSC